MNFLLRVLVSVVLGVVAAYIAGIILKHFGFDIFWGFVTGVIVGLAYFVGGPAVIR